MGLNYNTERITVRNDQTRKYELRPSIADSGYTEDFLIQRLGYLEDRLISCSVGEELRNIRKKANLSQDDVALKTGIPQSTISQYEAGTLSPAKRYIHGLIQAVGLDENNSESLEEAALRAKYGPEDKSLGSLLRFERKMAHLPIKVLAKQIHVSAAAYGKMERNVITPNWMIVERIAQVLNSQRLHDYAKTQMSR